LDILNKIGGKNKCHVVQWEIEDKKINFLLEGIAHADIITTVSPTYAKEILTEEYGAGLEEVLRAKEGMIFGVLNGIDDHRGQTMRQSQIERSDSSSEKYSWLEEKKLNKKRLQKRLGLKIDASIPLLSFIGRFDPKQKGIDIVAVGEGDYIFYEILDCLKNHRDLNQVKGIYYKKSGRIHYTGPRQAIRDLDNLPDYSYSLIKIDQYETFDLGGGKSISIMTSRGCPHRCKFCAIPVISPFWRGWSVEKVIAKIKKLQSSYGINNFYFQDDNLGANPERFKQLLSALCQLDKKIKWGTLGIRADTLSRLSDKELELIYQSGCHDLDIGVETGSQRVNQFINKGEAIETIIGSNQRLANFPIKIKYTFVIGFPTETKEEREKSIELALLLQKENQNAYTLFFAFTPIVGTSFFDLAVEHGFKRPESLERWSNLRFDDWLEKYPSWLSKRDVEEIEMICLASFFANKNVAYKFARPLLKILLFLYNPIAKLRFKNKFFQLPIELKLRRLFFAVKEQLSL